MNPKKQIQKLKEQIIHHDKLYYNLDKPEISDYEYDKLFQELVKLEQKHPELKTKDSPSQKVPGKALDKFEKANHSLPMLSLQNSYSKEEIKTFYERILKLLDKKQVECFVEPKLDGVAVELVYEKGILTKALTRGDGKTGENITNNIKTLKGLPLSLNPTNLLKSSARLKKIKSQNKLPELLEIRGEILIFKKDFKKINEEQEEAGLPIFANPRNLSAGSLRQLDPKVTASRPLRYFIHGPGLIQGSLFKTQSEFITALKNLSLPVFSITRKKLKPPWQLCQITQSLEDIFNYYEQMQELRHKLPFEIDGIVIKLNDFEQQKELGSIARSPRWAFAGKFPPEEGQTQVEDIILQVGRTGVVTPVARLKPLSLGGVVIRQASLHNFKDLQRKDVRIGDSVLVHRAGDVIPEVIKPIKAKRKKGLKVFQAPSQCPSCKNSLKERGDYLICPNKACPSMKLNRWIHFASKKAMDIEFLGEKSLKKFYEWGWIKNYSDIYKLKDQALAEKEGFGEKSQALLVKSLDNSKKTELSRLIFALGIPLIGEQTAQKISEKIYDLHAKKTKGSLKLKQAIKLLQNLPEKELEDIVDIGPQATQSFKSAFENSELIADLHQLELQGLHLAQRIKKGRALQGLQFVITGTLPEPRETVKKNIEDQGGKVLSQVSKKTNYLLTGENPGSKKEKAEKLGVPSLDWEGFLDILRR